MCFAEKDVTMLAMMIMIAKHLYKIIWRSIFPYSLCSASLYSCSFWHWKRQTVTVRFPGKKLSVIIDLMVGTVKMESTGRKSAPAGANLDSGGCGDPPEFNYG